MSTLKTFFAGFLAGLVCAALLDAAVHLYRHAYPGAAVVAKAAPEVQRQRTESVAVSRVRAFPQAVKHTLGLPSAVQAAPTAHVIAATKAQGTMHPQTVTAVLDTQTGQTSLYVRTDPLPWFAFENHGSVSLSRGIKNGAFAYRLGFREDFLQMKALHVGLVGNVDSDAHWYAGVGIAWRW